MSQDQQFMLFIAFISMLVLVFGYLLVWLKKRSGEKLQSLGRGSIEEDAYNQMQMVKSMSKIMGSRGYDTMAVDNVLLKAQRAYDDGRYAECLEIVNNAKRMLMRIKEEEKMEDRISPHVEKELEIIKRIGEKESSSQEMPPQVKDFVKKLPPNYLQSKFEIGVVEEKLARSEEGEVKEAAKLYLFKAKEAFQAKNYTEALKFAIRSNRILESGDVGVKGPSISESTYSADMSRPAVTPSTMTPVTTLIEEEEKEEEEELRCPKCGAIVRPEDKYCWNCGAKLVFIYTCPNCGGEVSSEDNYCRHCGYKLR